MRITIINIFLIIIFISGCAKVATYNPKYPPENKTLFSNKIDYIVIADEFCDGTGDKLNILNPLLDEMERTLNAKGGYQIIRFKKGSKIKVDLSLKRYIILTAQVVSGSGVRQGQLVKIKNESEDSASYRRTRTKQSRTNWKNESSFVLTQVSAYILDEGLKVLKNTLVASGTKGFEIKKSENAIDNIGKFFGDSAFTELGSAYDEIKATPATHSAIAAGIHLRGIL